MPPEDLAEMGVKNWKKKEASRYFNWFMDIRAKRVEDFLKYLDYRLTGDPKVDLDAIGEKVFHSLNETQFHTIRETDGGKKLNDAGLAIAADLGLLLAQLLEEKHPKLYWEIGKGPKVYHAYNLPVLKGFPKDNEWEPIFYSINSNGYSLNYLKSPYDWADFFEASSKKLE